MKHFLSLLIFCISLFGHSQAQTDSSEYLLNKLRAGTINDSERKELKTLAFGLQNSGQSLDESKHDYAAALTLVSKAIIIFTSLRDTLNEANNRKFKGYLLGRFDKFAEGKVEIRQAIKLFQLKNADWGVAVSQFDLSRLFEFENKLDSALFYCNIAISYWKSKGNSARIFLNQNMLINLLTKLNRLDEAKSAQSESSKMAENPEQHWLGLLDFYMVSKNLYKAAKESKAADLYQKLYSNKISDLKKQGFTAISYFQEVK
ncbi:MAG: hypothetical protein ABI685_02695 [Ferruginibacter sp.]